MQHYADLKEIDGIKLPRIRRGYKKPEPQPGVYSNGKPVKGKTIVMPDGRVFPSLNAAHRATGIHQTKLRDHIKGEKEDWVE